MGWSRCGVSYLHMHTHTHTREERVVHVGEAGGGMKEVGVCGGMFVGG
jgi:hypothetical protein